MSEEFQSLRIDGAAIREILFVPTQTLQISMLVLPEAGSENQVVTQCRLRFDKIHAAKFSFDAEPWSQLVSHHELKASDFLSAYESSESRLAKIWQADAILAEQVSNQIEQEIPYLGKFIYPPVQTS
jgi:hypothetical protein